METEETAVPNADQKLFVNAQHAIYAIMAKGDFEEKAGHVSMGMDELIRSLALATAMVIEGNGAIKTRKQMREAAEHYAKMTRGFAELLREQADQDGVHYLDHVISSISQTH